MMKQSLGDIRVLTIKAEPSELFPSILTCSRAFARSAEVELLFRVATLAELGVNFQTPLQLAVE
jgi:hypothetical protein